MICIFCTKEREPSVEHVFPLAIGGRLKTDRVCRQCNSLLGSRVDNALSDFLIIRQRRADLGLAGNSGKPPGRFDWLTGNAETVGDDGGRLHTSFEPTSGKLIQRRLYSAKEMTTPDGQHIRQITIDAKDRDQIPVIIQRERKRDNQPPLSDEELAKIMQQVTDPIENVAVIKKDIKVSFAFLRHAMFKIAYELAFIWLGDGYLDDPLAAEIRTAVCSEDVAATDSLYGRVDFLAGCEAAFNHFWIPHPSHHLAYSNVHLETQQYTVGVRIFDIYAAIVPVSRNTNHADASKCRFFVQDAVSGRIVDSSFDAERDRLALLMMENKRTPPFADPLTQREAVAKL